MDVDPNPPKKSQREKKNRRRRTKENKKWSQRTDLNGTNNAQEDKRESGGKLDVL